MLDPRTEAQLAHLRSDEWLREKARLASEMTAEERLETAAHLCRVAGETLQRQGEDAAARVDEARGGIDDAAAAALRRLARALRP
jgi:hypothetical protein